VLLLQLHEYIRSFTIAASRVPDAPEGEKIQRFLDGLFESQVVALQNPQSLNEAIRMAIIVADNKNNWNLPIAIIEDPMELGMMKLQKLTDEERV